MVAGERIMAVFHRTKARFIPSVAFDATPVQDAAKIGALLSVAAAISFVVARQIGAQKQES